MDFVNLQIKTTLIIFKSKDYMLLLRKDKATARKSTEQPQTSLAPTQCHLHNAVQSTIILIVVKEMELMLFGLNIVNLDFSLHFAISISLLFSLKIS